MEIERIVAKIVLIVATHRLDPDLATRGGIGVRDGLNRSDPSAKKMRPAETRLTCSIPSDQDPKALNSAHV